MLARFLFASAAPCSTGVVWLAWWSRVCLVWLVMGPICLVEYGLFAQAPTTVQLPTIRQFRVGTSVLVPDRGSALLGGVNSYQSGSNSRGVPVLGRLPGIGRAFNNRAFGANANSGQVRAQATIIDLQEMDAALRGTEAARRVRERMLAEQAGGFYMGRDGLGDGGLYGGSLVLVPEDATLTRAKYLSENMGRADVSKVRLKQGHADSRTRPPRGAASKAATVSKSPVAVKAKKSEAPLILRGRQQPASTED